MDYRLAALKLLCAQLKDAKEVASQNAMSLGNILFQRAWLQGVLVSASDENDHVGAPLLLDDGTGVVQLALSSADFRLRPWKTGMYVMVVGGYMARAAEPPTIKVHKIVDLSQFPDREAMWYLEVMEAYKLFYRPLIEELE
ncbi:recQ-mediated genome instability protein 2 isoform X2 [Carya illinoinensis]|uniref:RecQ-mediated genome instability protein 2 n=1 Tax=Carya illinoinensis TaxID=32201 RepID=A0A8T1NLQ5_CARIL|nr:recQ-mediated genome instability protein 2 isoform X2 [Carya illinoinensis]KAG6629720.1 hypothetical protein CIPAW_14G104900 [Carya illinoinensis]